jgi:hypothetical protein
VAVAVGDISLPAVGGEVFADEALLRFKWGEVGVVEVDAGVEHGDADVFSAAVAGANAEGGEIPGEVGTALNDVLGGGAAGCRCRGTVIATAVAGGAAKALQDLLHGINAAEGVVQEAAADGGDARNTEREFDAALVEGKWNSTLIER